jgi:hypothetical protein
MNVYFTFGSNSAEGGRTIPDSTLPLHSARTRFNLLQRLAHYTPQAAYSIGQGGTAGQSGEKPDDKRVKC